MPPQSSGPAMDLSNVSGNGITQPNAPESAQQNPHDALQSLAESLSKDGADLLSIHGNAYNSVHSSQPQPIDQLLVLLLDLLSQ